MKQVLKCNNCGVSIVELEDGKITAHISGVRFAENPIADNLAWATCLKCQHETHLEGPFFEAFASQK